MEGIKSGGAPSGWYGDIFDMFGMGGGGGQKAKKAQKGKPVLKELKVTLEDVF